MPVNIKVVYITKYNKKFILNKPDNFAYYIKSIMNSNLIDVSFPDLARRFFFL